MHLHENETEYVQPIQTIALLLVRGSAHSLDSTNHFGPNDELPILWGRSDLHTRTRHVRHHGLRRYRGLLYFRIWWALEKRRGWSRNGRCIQFYSTNAPDHNGWRRGRQRPRLTCG